jgi:predicted Zn-dependent protease
MRIDGGTTSVQDMIAQCQEGIYVNRFSGIELMDAKSCMLSGVTNGGCLLIKNGKITKAAKNFRFLDSPFFFLNTIEAIGPARRAAFGYTPPSYGEWAEWPRLPVIAPTLMVRDFNFVGIADAV